MMEKSNDDMNDPEFKQIIANYSDDEIRRVLKKRKLYQKEAADFATEEAIRRRIIHSEQDLFSSEFREEPEKFSIFPTIENEKARAKFRKSIARSLFILGVLPMIWGAIKIFETQNLEGILIFIFGTAWSFASFRQLHAINMKLIYFMFFLSVLFTAYLIKTIISVHSLTTIDLLVMIITVGFVLYGIGFLGKLKD